MARALDQGLIATFVLAVGLALAGCQGGAKPDLEAPPAAQPADPATLKTAVFAGGCFWCVEKDFEALPGVVRAVSGYAGGKVDNPSYEQVSAGGTGHLEVVEVTYDPARVTYRQLVDQFWLTIDATDPGGQFCDRGESYQTAVFAQGPEERKEAEESKAAIQEKAKLPVPIVTPILDQAKFWPAEDYHQDYYKKNPVRYKYYRSACGRDARLKSLWGDLKK